MNKNNATVNFVLPNNTSPQNDVQHQWMGEMLFSYRTGDTATFPNDRTGFVEVDTNKTLAAGGSTKYNTINASNQYFTKTASSDGKRVEVNFIGQPLTSTTARTMKGFDAKSVFNMNTTDGSLEWEITLKNKSTKYIEFGDIGLPMPWNNKYLNVSDTYDNRVTVHNFAGADSGYSYAIRTSGEGNFMMFTPVPESGARIEYVDYWLGDTGEVRSGSLYSNWVGDSGGWFPGLSVLYIHSKDISKTGRGYFTDATSLVLAPQAEKTYKFKFSAVRAGDNTPQTNAASSNNASTSMEDREKNLRSILYKSGMIDAVALPGFQAAINMPVKLALHFDDTKVDLQSIQIQNVTQNDPYDAAHIPVVKNNDRAGMVNNSRTGRGLPSGNPGYTKSATFLETKVVNGEQYHIYALTFDNIGNNSVRVNYSLNSNPGVNKFTQFEFNILAELDLTSQAHSQFMVNSTQDKVTTSPTFGIYRDWYLTTGLDTVTSHWGDDWSHDNINFMTMKNYLDPNAGELQSIENYLIDFMWKNYMKYTQSSFTVANYLNASGIYTTSSAPYVRTFSEAMEATAFFNMYRIQKAYPNMIQYRESPQFYLEKAYGIYYNRVGAGATGFYGEQQIPDLIEALKEEGMTTQYNNLRTKFAQNKATSVLNARYPYGSEFEYDNTGEEGAYAAAKALRTYYPTDSKVASALSAMKAADLKTRAMRGIQPNWYFYSVPVFRAGEGWWNFQYTASLAGSIMDDMLRYQADGRTADQTAVAQQRNYAAKISNFNAINMGQISAQSVGSSAWRFNAHKGGTGTKNVYDGGTRVMNNGWQDFSGESEEGFYGSLLRISSDIAVDPVFGLFGYGATVSDAGNAYNITPKDGFGKRINLIKEKIYLTSESDEMTNALIQKDGTAITLQIANLSQKTHASRITLDGPGVANGYYTIKLNGANVGQFYVQNNKGVAMFQMSSALTTAEVIIEKATTGSNQAPQVTTEVVNVNRPVNTPILLNGIVTDDGAPNGATTYLWEVVSTPAGGALSFTNNKAAVTNATGTVAGSYTARLTANDGALSTSSLLSFTLGGGGGGNNAPIVDAGANATVNLPSAITLSGTATDDGLPSGSSVTTTWSLQSGPGTASIANASALNTTATVTVPGTYVFLLTASDSALQSTDTVTKTVQGTLPDQLVRYEFGETSGTSAADSSGNSKTGTLNGGATFAAGQTGNAVALNGTNGYVSMPSGIASGSASVTIAAWVKANSLSNWTRIFDIGSSTTNYMFLSPQPGAAGLRFAITNNGNGSEQQISSTTAFPTGVWKHVAVTISGSTGRLYVDGVQVATNTSMTLNPSSLGTTTNNWIGRSQFSGDAYFNGSVDDFRIYSRALSASEISALMGGGTTPTDIASQATASTSFVSSWESLAGLNDGYTPTSSNDRGHPVYGNWDNPGTTQWVQYTFSANKTISSVDVYWFDDNGGIDLPASYTIQYWNGSAWTNVASPSGLGLLANQYNTTTFTPVTTNQIRLSITAKSTTSTGIESWKVYGN
ncbi:LamG-like jellyroll fold domain-containing protein [Cohnella sp. M.A.Huq-80]